MDFTSVSYMTTPDYPNTTITSTPEHLHSSNSTAEVNAEDNTALGVTYLILSLLVMIANGVVVFVIAKTQELHLPTLWIIAFMALCDFLYGFHFLIFGTPSAFFNRFPYSDKVMVFCSCYFTIISAQTVFNTALTVIDRYIAIKWPFGYSTIATKRNYALLVVSTVLLSICRLLLIVLSDAGFFYNATVAGVNIEFDTIHGRVASVSIVFIVFGVILFCSISIFRDILRSRRQIHPRGTKTKESILKFPLMVTISSTVFLISYVPILVSIIWNYTGKSPKVLAQVGVASLLSNSLWNVFIYTTIYSPFRDGVMRLFCNSYYRRKKRTEIQNSLVTRTCT